jgi:hypothetical protein
MTRKVLEIEKQQRLLIQFNFQLRDTWSALFSKNKLKEIYIIAKSCKCNALIYEIQYRIFEL